VALVSLEIASTVILLTGVPPLVDLAGRCGVIAIIIVTITITIVVVAIAITVIAIVSVADEDDCVVKPRATAIICCDNT